MRRFFRNIFIIMCWISTSCNSGNERNQHTSPQDLKDTTSTIQSGDTIIDSDVQSFEINSQKDQQIIGKHGTVVTFPAGCFGNSAEPINVELIECYSIQKMLLNGLSTITTDRKLLESDGMIYLNALDNNGDTLEIVKGKVKVEMPTKQVKQGIRIFNGKEIGNGISWDLTNEQVSNGKISNNETAIQEIEKIESDTSEIVNSKRKPENTSNIVIDKKIKNENLVTYIFQISKMGWINCDRYLENKNPVELLVDINSNNNKGKYYVVLGNSNSIVVGDEIPNKESQLVFKNIPKNEPVTIVGMSTVGDKIYFGMKDYKVTGEQITFPELALTSRDEITSAMLEKFGNDIWSRPRPSL